MKKMPNFSKLLDETLFGVYHNSTLKEKNNFKGDIYHEKNACITACYADAGKHRTDLYFLRRKG